ncbi:SNF2 family N-terminal domain-containing protein [Hyaloraphidium curvatum]|nr:SNF2 family N-terminal domain-containing protein [Hyaloraphidium curvatum]
MKNQEVGTGHHGGILADDMGLGKTIQTIALMLLNPPKSADKAKTTLIVCPTSLLHQWQRELTTRTIAGTFKIFLHYGPKKAKDPRTFAGYDVVLTTFGTLAAEFPDLRNETKPQKGDSFAHLGEAGKEEADREFERDMQGPLGRNVWYRCVLDEAHKISNKRTKVANSAKWLTAKYRWCLTGTPFSNSVEELFSLLQFLAVPTWSDWKMFRKQIVQPIRHGSSRRAIEKVHVLLQGICLRRHKMSQLDGKPILETLPPKTEHSEVVHFSTAERDFYQALENRTRLKFNEYVRRGTVMNNYANILALLSKLRQACCHPNLIKTVAVGPGEDDGDEDDEDAQDTGLARRMSATVVQRVKEQGLDAVECAVCTDQVVFDEGVLIQACGHGYCRTCIEAYIEGGGNNGCPQCRKEVNEDALVRFETFRKVHMPEAVPKPKPEPKDEEEVPPFKSSAKIDRCLEILDRIRADKPGEKTIVFTQWLGIHALLAVPLAQRGMRFVRIDGRMNVKKRAESVEAFANDPNVNILIISLQCGSLGLNLTCANHVVLFDVWWNPQVEGQAMDRAHRFGQTKPVSVHKITVADSVEDRILELQDRKRKMFQAAFDGGSLKKIGGRLTLGELQDLFGREDPQGGEDDDDLF